LKDIIDLDYFISIDEALDSKEDIESRTIKDRRIYSQCESTSQTEKALLFSWLAFRRQEFIQNTDTKESYLLPGSIFSSLYAWILYAMVFSGLITGISLAYSFLTYHGKSPINVTVFVALFILLQVFLVFLILVLFIGKAIGAKNPKNRFHSSITQAFVSTFFSDILPGIIKKADLSIFRKNLNTLEYISSLIRMKSREYQALFFWSFFILTSVFAICFSAGALGGVLFRVLVSDMAFGWQSTLMATSSGVHGIVSALALPWSWFVPEILAHPSLEQIEGTRIVLKDGISVLATRDLVSWWPFICLGILFYAVIPRGLLIILGVLAQKHALRNIDFNRPEFRQLIARMQSPVLDIDADEIPVNDVIEKNGSKDIKEMPSFRSEADMSGQRALLLSSESVYTDEAIEKAVQSIKQYLFSSVNRMTRISFDFNDDAGAIREIEDEEIDLVILLYEVWQPPIRGLLHYITQIKAIIPRNNYLWILLTRDAGQEDLSVDDNDLNFKVWKNAVYELGNPEIVVKRLL